MQWMSDGTAILGTEELILNHFGLKLKVASSAELSNSYCIRAYWQNHFLRALTVFASKWL